MQRDYLTQVRLAPDSTAHESLLAP
jgi:hypothetical protein